ncbi:hypothetical protein SteCoe_27471 [Stentor coeruleus]|uniref:Aurora kinase n=1 Tax=Stentor coeruleus TaxID=5963 RepID=A0A1R2BAG0_9CILI|nr:hypothetical protein SteCoe_27471 [Stentor coeruleus]
MGCSNSIQEASIYQRKTSENYTPANTPVTRRPRKNIFGAIQANDIANYYEILKVIGSGSLGTLFYAKHIQTQEFRTLREINKMTLKDDTLSIVQEISILKDLDHPNVLKVYEAIETPRSVYIALEYISGHSLMEKVKNTGCETMLARAMLDIFSALAYLHTKGIAHCNICPEYIVQTNGEGYDVMTKLIGFTCSQRMNDKQEINLNKISYTYAAPELLKGEFDEKVDIWSCGILLYDLLVGRLPFPSKTKTGIVNCILHGDLDFTNSMFTSLSYNAQDLIKNMLNLDPLKRPTAQQNLLHPMLNASKNKISISLEAIKKLRVFKVKNRAARSILAKMNFKLGKEDHEIINYFKEIDENFDGRVSKDELIEAFDRLGIDITGEVDEIMCNMDIDGNGYIDYSELKVALTEWNEELKEKNLIRCFKVVDGKIIIDSLRIELIDIKQLDWIKFLQDCFNDGISISVTVLKNYLKDNINQ